MPQISIIVPVYKAESTIGRCVDSIRNQTFSDIEIILIDDGSPDRSGEICDAFAEMDERIRVIHKKNGGVSSARNAGLEIASGKYLMFCDSDDYVAPEWCQWMYEAMNGGKIHLAYCAVAVVSNGNTVYQTPITAKRCIAPKEYLEIVSYVRINELWNKIFLADIVRNFSIRFDTQISRCEDVLFVLEYLKHIGSNDYLCYGSPVLYYYTASDSDSLSTTFVNNYLQIEQDVLASLQNMLDQFGISKEAYMPWYSKHAALLMIGVISNIFLDKKHGMIYKLHQLREVTSCQDYDTAIRFGGLKQVVQGRYLRILQTKQPIYIYFYHTLSILKKAFVQLTDSHTDIKEKLP